MLGALRVDAEGYFLDPEDWSEQMAVQLAREEGIVLSADHWEIIRFMRKYYEEHRIIPDVRHVMKYFAATKAPGLAGRNDLFVLFPYGYVKQACRIAGMRRPRAWSTG